MQAVSPEEGAAVVAEEAKAAVWAAGVTVAAVATVAVQ